MKKEQGLLASLNKLYENYKKMSEFSMSVRKLSDERKRLQVTSGANKNEESSRSIKSQGADLPPSI